MKISILCSDDHHPINVYLNKWIEKIQKKHKVKLVRKKKDLDSGDILFCVSCSEIIGEAEKKNFRACLVLHASKLPKGRGWSPHIWEIINGSEMIFLSIIEADNPVDSGSIWFQNSFKIPKNCLWNEINHILFTNEIDGMDFVINNFKKIKPKNQNNKVLPSYYKKRSKIDSKLDPKLSIKDQFDLMRTCDPNRYPAFFELYGKKYKIILEKCSKK